MKRRKAFDRKNNYWAMIMGGECVELLQIFVTVVQVPSLLPTASSS
jgi:hypothetical protein